ncbi:hypothetical protein ACH5RR_017799 [Cinchona calisaya]|uniref:Uncharacterized protein n=1 Tax=Cinchona calisaya TaxID=153742 RepID=A0ABD2ZJL5_9GENT
MGAPSSLELMLKQIQKMEEDQSEDVPPALPTRPVIRARQPRSRRRLPPFCSQKSFDQDMIISSSFDQEGMSDQSKRAKCGDSVESIYQMESTERVGLGAATEFLAENVNGSIEGCGCRNHENGTLDKVGNFGGPLQWILGIQRHLNGHQTSCYNHELNIGVITLQSFVRGENARKYFMKKMTAIAVIQKRVKDQLRSTILEKEDQAAICLQARIRGWLAWRHYNSIDQKERQLNEDRKKMKNQEKKDQIEVPYSVLVDLQRRVLKTEALLDKKKEENATLRLQIKQLERKRQQYETKMKSMEKMWQDQLTSMQISLAAAKKNSSSKHAVGKLGLLFALPENQDEDAHDSSPRTRLQVNGRLNSDQLNDHQNGILDESDGILIQIEPGRVASSANPEEELESLKLNFKSWKKDFKSRLMVAKTTIKKLGHSETGRSGQKKWWGR